jgi:hypothetical protein
MKAVRSSETLRNLGAHLSGYNPEDKDMKNVLVMKSSLRILLSEFTITRHTSDATSCTVFYPPFLYVILSKVKYEEYTSIKKTTVWNVKTLHPPAEHSDVSDISSDILHICWA